MNYKKLHITIYFVLIWSFSFAQQFLNYSTKDGLPSNHVYTIVQDAKGFMWFLTDKGMARYNGKTFKTFTTKNGLPINDVWDALPTPDGKVWYLSKTPKLGYIQNDTVVSFSNQAKNQIINPIYSSQVGDSVYPTEPHKIFSLQNNKWVALLNSTYKTQPNERITIKHGLVSSIVLNRSGQLKLYNKQEQKINTITTTGIYGTTGTRGQLNDSLFFWTNQKSYFILNLNTHHLKHVDLKQAIGLNTVDNLRVNVVDNQVQVSGSGFVAKLNQDLEIVDPYFFPKNIDAHFGFIDKLNTIWLATFNNGIYKLPYVKQKAKYHLLNHKIQSFNCIDSSLVVGVYQKGFYKFKDGIFHELISDNDYVYGASHLKLNNINFYAFRNTLIKEKKGKKTIVKVDDLQSNDLLANEVGRKFVCHNHKIYSNFSFGINRINASSLKIEKEFKQRGVNDLISFKNRLLIATNNGLKEVVNDTLKPVIFSNIKFDKPILNIKLVDNNKLLINTDGFGAYLSDLKIIQPLALTDYLIVEDAFIADNIIWLATNTGVLKFKKVKDNYQYEKRFTVSDGLPTNHIKRLYVDQNNLILGTNNGIAILPKNQKNVPQLLDVYIANATYNSKAINQKKSAFKYSKNNSINITVDNIDFSDNNTNLTYQFKLQPSQKQWVSSNTNVFNFNNLQPDDYVFYVKSGSIKKQLKFTILPLWWQLLWVKILLTLLSIAIIILSVWKLSKKSQEKKNNKLIQDKKLSEIQLKALRSQMNPHFVFNSLSAIQYYINNNQIEASEAYLVKFSKLIRQFFELSKETDISLKEEVGLITNYLDIEKLRFKDKFDYQINISETIKVNQVNLPTMLLQPIVENAINHGIFNKVEKGKVTININEAKNHAIKIEIIDDGVGFVNTIKKTNHKIKSSNVLHDRLRFLNKSGQWNVTYSVKALHPNHEDKGNVSTFLISKTN
ncbi:hypothetical protein DZC78_04650 [Olleya aquimaris]|nr:hypothetical protein DZC78_04650 [Olleya aquimaris]